MINDLGKSQVTVIKTELLEIVRKNLVEHLALFDKAEKAFRAKAIQEMEENLEKAKKGKEFSLVLSLHPPTSYEKDYNKIIRMLEMSTADEVSITETQFSQYVLNDWPWAKHFNSSVSTYVGG